MKKRNIVIVIMLVIATLMNASLPVYAATEHTPETSCEIDVQLNDTIGFKLFKSHASKIPVPNQEKGKSYTSDSYNGYFYLISTNQVISTHSFTAYFSYDGTLVTCYRTESNVLMDNDYTGNLRSNAEGEGHNSVTPTLAYGYVTFVLYNQNGSVNTEVTVNIYCNQSGTTWVERQG